MNLADPDDILRLDLNENEKVSRNRKKKGWNVFYSRYVLDLKRLSYEDLKKLVTTENLRGVHEAPRPQAPRPPRYQRNIRDGRASLAAPAPLRALAHARLGGERVSCLFGSAADFKPARLNQPTLLRPFLL